MLTLKSSLLLLALGSVSNAWSLSGTKSSGPVHPEKRSGPILDNRQVRFPNLNNAVGKAVCSAILSISPYAATSTVYSTSVEPSYTSTSVSVTETTSTPATVTVPTVVATNVVTNTLTTATSTITPFTTTTTTTFTRTVTSTSRINNNRGGPRAAKRAVSDDRFTSLSDRLQNFASTQVSSSCSEVVNFKTSTSSAVTTTTTNTYTLTTTTVTDQAATPTVTSSSTSLTTTTKYDTATVTTTVTSTSVIPTTTTRVVNKCGPTMDIRYFTGSALRNSQQITTRDRTAEACCESCHNIPGCSYWGFGDGRTCYIGKVNGRRNTRSRQCPAGTNQFQYRSGHTFIAGYGPCGSQ